MASGDCSLDIVLDYTTPKYRDASVGKYLYGRLLKDEGYTALTIQNPSEQHEKYLNKVGFVKEGDRYRFAGKAD